MKIVIDIPDKKWSTFQNDTYSGLLDKDLYKSIKNGTPLKKGHWIYPNIPPQYIDGQKCSECGHNKYGEKTNYCPNCGAEMSGKIEVK